MPIDSIGARDVVKQMLDLSLRRAEVASQNIAGASVPGFVSQRVDADAFRTQLLGTLSSADRTALQSLRIPTSPAERPYSADQEIAELVAASSDYQVLLEALNRHMSLMRLAVSSRGQA